ncbi:amino acid/polyamine/organocation transporter, APC superfamily [Quadrisphaera granulorum]|uniref:Amino acid/polyamine/organocation transporter (APC superfamily) n=1 Tax=Quadrisphaera granulorum TaxID=317664 RepID=A0A316AFE7_9ACTN|nr:APC family permease [Quadrisphaera granulorum]PWJ56331.1 amino acid/polyamine/organocation transporter (APC superfamily) [Quadrisphaera granulorum]SZE94965.1 amino acid/polyamine/organocation transporter, APC superfamily [Quadrisphaera granulorum]
MATTTTGTVSDEGLKRTITGRLLYFYVLGDVLGSGVYVLIGLVAGAVGGAFWIAFAAGVTVAAITGLAYAELVTKYPQAAGASLYVSKAFRNPTLTFFITICMLSASFAAIGSLASGFSRYFGSLFDLPPALLVSVVFVALVAVVNYIGITESVVINMVMTFVEVAGLVIIAAIGVIALTSGDADLSVLTEFSTEGSPIIAVVAGVTLAFFAMTGFENAANVAEETINPSRNFPRALVGGMVTAGVIYVIVAVSAALVVPVDQLAGADAALLEVVEAGLLPLPVGVMIILFSIIAMIAISNTTLVTTAAGARILYGMGRVGVMPRVFARVHPTRRSPVVALGFTLAVVVLLMIVGSLLTALGGPDVVERLATITVVFLVFVYALVIVCALKQRGKDEHDGVFRANTPLLLLGIVGNAAILVYTIVDDPTSLYWVAGLLAVGGVLYAVQRARGGGANHEALLADGVERAGDPDVPDGVPDERSR